ncbi:hypothetical protein C7S18_17735 [Ahniella affigens]|uniref:DNA-binding protein n=1 Tax=Ahniella affigens TaxID=2021234 RepID=A0A2P1PVN1_9GAMM|nr:hypothetical protein C7S18_17735 [Ahniella affigens]
MSEQANNLIAALERDLLGRYGPIIGADDLRQALGFTSQDAFRQAVFRGQVPVPIFALPNRRGKFALAKDIARWLAEVRLGGETANTSNPADEVGQKVAG